MGTLALPRRYRQGFNDPRRKPDGFLKVDRNNPLSNGLIFFPVFSTQGGGIYDAVSEKIYRDESFNLEDQSSITTQYDHFGQHASFTGAANSQRLHLTDDQSNPDEGYRTVLTGAVYTDAGVDHTLLHHGTTIGVDNILLWADTLSGALRPAINAGATHVGASGSIPINQFVVWGTGYVVTSGAAAAQHWVNGRTSGSAGADIGDTRFALSNPLNFGNEDGGGRMHKGSVYFYAIWDRELTPAEHLSFANNPYQLLKPANDPTYFFAASSGTDLSGTAAVSSASSTSSSGAKDTSGTASANSVSALITSGLKSSSDASFVSSVTSASAAGSKSASNTASASNSTLTASVGSKHAQSDIYESIATSTIETGIKQSFSTASVSSAPTTSATGTTSESKSGTASISASESSVVVGAKGAVGSIDTTVSTDANETGSGDRFGPIALAIASVSQALGQKAVDFTASVIASSQSTASGVKFIIGESTSNITSKRFTSIVVDDVFNITVNDDVLIATINNESISSSTNNGIIEIIL